MAQVIGEASRIETLGDNTGPCGCSIRGIDPLLDMGRDKHHRLAVIHRFANRFKACRGDVSPAAAHELEKEAVVEAVKGEVALGLPKIRTTLTIPEDVGRGNGIEDVERTSAAVRRRSRC